ncbi:MAG: ankyrin repeat domain-containing protein [Wolbachia sp.]|nr:ankyrin repeat domain-containing protein [Wolbachia sp.]MDD9336409.1 ankyrin repeat domain-containing protein [Wolbachia sp.]
MGKHYCIAIDGREATAEFLLTSIGDEEKNKLINAQDSYGNTSLHYATQYSRYSDMVTPTMD